MDVLNILFNFQVTYCELSITNWSLSLSTQQAGLLPVF